MVGINFNRTEKIFMLLHSLNAVYFHSYLFLYQFSFHPLLLLSLLLGIIMLNSSNISRISYARFLMKRIKKEWMKEREKNKKEKYGKIFSLLHWRSNLHNNTCIIIIITVIVRKEGWMINKKNKNNRVENVYVLPKHWIKSTTGYCYYYHHHHHHCRRLHHLKWFQLSLVVLNGNFYI